VNKSFCSPAAKITYVLAGFLAAVIAVSLMDDVYRSYIGRLTGYRMPPGGAVFYAGLYIACTAALLAAVYNSKKPDSKGKDVFLGHLFRLCHETDFFMAITLMLCVWFLCLYCVFIIYRNPYLLLACSAAAYFSTAALLAGAAARLRDGTLKRTLYWKRFFGLHKASKPFGLLMALFLFGILFYLLALCPFETFGAGLLIVRPVARAFNVKIALNASGFFHFNPLTYVFFMFALFVFSYLCKKVLTLSDEYEKMNIEKIRAERFKSELITNVSHDIRTPLTSIINYVDLMQKLPVDNADFINYTDVLRKKSARLKTLTDDLLEASKAGTGNVSVDMQMINLHEVIGQIAGEFDDQFNERGLKLALHQPDSGVAVPADGRHIWRVLENLFSNAVKYALPGTRVFAEIAERDGAGAFTLKNTSQNPIDISGDMLAEQFIRGDRSRKTEGSGLGLYIAKSLVELMGGALTIRVSGDLFEAEIIFAKNDRPD